MAPTVLPTNEEIAALPTKELIELHNLHASVAVKKFTDRKTAVARTVKVVEPIRAARAIETEMGAGDLPASPKKAKAVKEPKATRESLSSAIRAAIFEGLTNVAIVEKFHLPANKRHYPGWFRSKLVRDGKLKASK